MTASNRPRHLEYELDSVAKASSVTALLNDGDDTRPWQLESVVATGTPPQFGFVQTSRAVRGLWSATLDKL